MTEQAPTPFTAAHTASMPDAHTATLQRQAQQRVGRKMGFAIHALVFLVVNLGLAARHLLGNDDLAARPWPLWGWALGLAIHGLVTALSLSGGDLRERWVAREVAALRRRG